MYKLTANNDNIAYGIKEFVCDTIEDLNTLPSCEMGSIVFVIETSEAYIMNGKKEWVKM